VVAYVLQNEQAGWGHQLRLSSVCVSSSVDILPFGVTIPATVLQRSEIKEGLMNFSVHAAAILIHREGFKNLDIRTYSSLFIYL
jgi:hypothetical protein